MTGILTRYYVNETILYNINSIKITKNNFVLNTFSPENTFIFSDEFLIISFIEIENSYLEFVDILLQNDISNEIYIISHI